MAESVLEQSCDVPRCAVPVARARDGELGKQAREFERADPETIVRWAWERFGAGVKLGTAFNPEGLVLIDVLSRIAPELRVFTIDTGRLHEETYELMDRVRVRYGIEVEVYFPERRSVEKLVRENGPCSFRRSVEDRMRCCEVRKVEPLGRALEDLAAWMAGLRRQQSCSRSQSRAVEWDGTNGLIKINPLAHWTWDQVLERIRRNDIPVSPLLYQGYTSVGCAPCTRPVRAGENQRAGRWWWEKGSTRECGLHR